MLAASIEIQLMAGIARLQADMDRANRIVGDATSRMGRAAGVVGGALGAIAGALSVAAFAGWIKGAIDSADAASKLSAKTGVAVKDIAGLQLAYDLGGAGGDAFAGSMVKLSKAIVGGNDGLSALGIKTKGANGQLLENKAVLYSVADAFAKMDDGARKTAMAVEIFGKSGADLIPLLNGGAEGFRQMDEMARKLGLRFSDETVKKAELFNDTLDLISMGSQGVARGIAAELLPTLTSLAGSLLESMTSGDKLKSTADTLAAGMKLLYTVAVGTVWIFSTIGKTIGAAGAQIVAVMSGDFKLASKIGKEWQKDVGDTWEATAKALKDTWSGAGGAALEEMAKASAAQKARDKELKAEKAARDAALKKSAAEYASAVKSANNLIDAMEIEASQIGLNADQIKMMAAARGAAKAPEAEQRARIMKIALASDIATKALLAKADADKVVADAQKDSDAGISSINAETAALMLKIKTHGMLPEAITLAAIAELEASKQSLALTDAGIADIQRRIEALKGLAAAQSGSTALDSGSSLTKAKELLDVLVAVDNATKSAAAGMAESFGRVGSAIGGLTTALSGYAVQQQAIVAQLAADKAGAKGDSDKIGKMEVAAANASAQARVKSYGDMAGAAKGFFKENSKGYKTMELTEKAFRAYQIGMEIKNMLVKSGLLTTFTGLFIANKAVEKGAMIAGAAVDDTITGKSIINSLARAGADTIAGVAKAFAQLGAWGFVAAGAIIGFMGKMGVFGGTGGGGPASTTFEDRQKKQGTGTVLGDNDAKSESIAKSLEAMENYASLELGYQSSMLTALRNIESALGGAAKNILQTTGITGGSGFGTQNSATKSTFGSDKSTTITDSGVRFASSFGALRNGSAQGSQYEDVTKTSDGGWLRGNSSNKSTNVKNLSAEAMKPFTLIFDNMGTLLVDAGVKLGKDSAQLTSALNAMPINFAVSLRNLKGQELENELAAGVSVAFDQVTKALFPTIEQFRKMNEGLGETLVRVASNVMAVDSVFAAMGKSTIVSTTNTRTSFFGLLSSTITTVGEMSLEAKERLVEAAGGLDKFASSASSFMKNFYSDAEQQAATKARLNPVLAKFGLSTEGSNAQQMFKDFVLGLNTSTLAGRETYATLMNIQQAFKDVTSTISDERASLQGDLDELTMSSAQLLNEQRMALDASNRGIFDQIQGITRLRAAQEASKTSLSDMIGKMKSFGDSARTLRDGLMLGSLSTLTPMQQYEEARRQRDATRTAAMGGDTVAQSNLSAMQTAFLTISQKVNGGDAQYSADFAGVMQMSDEISKWSAGQIDVAQASLDALNKQVIGIADLNLSMLNVVRAVEMLPQVLVGQPVVNWSGMGADNTVALVQEVRALRSSNEALVTEVKGLRAEQKTQTGDQINAAAQIAAKSTADVVDGLHATAKPRATASNSTANLS